MGSGRCQCFSCAGLEHRTQCPGNRQAPSAGRQRGGPARRSVRDRPQDLAHHGPGADLPHPRDRRGVDQPTARGSTQPHRGPAPGAIRLPGL